MLRHIYSVYCKHNIDQPLDLLKFLTIFQTLINDKDIKFIISKKKKKQRNAETFTVNVKENSIFKGVLPFFIFLKITCNNFLRDFFAAVTFYERTRYKNITGCPRIVVFFRLRNRCSYSKITS